MYWSLIFFKSQISPDCCKYDPFSVQIWPPDLPSPSPESGPSQWMCQSSRQYPSCTSPPSPSAGPANLYKRRPGGSTVTSRAPWHPPGQRSAGPSHRSRSWTRRTWRTEMSSRCTRRNSSSWGNSYSRNSGASPRPLLYRNTPGVCYNWYYLFFNECEWQKIISRLLHFGTNYGILDVRFI